MTTVEFKLIQCLRHEGTLVMFLLHVSWFSVSFYVVVRICCNSSIPLFSAHKSGSWAPHLCPVCAEQPVPVSEVRGIVGTLLTVVGLVVGGPAHAGKQSVQGPGQVVAAVVLHGQPAVEEVEEGFAQGVAAQHPHAAQSQQQQRQQLHGAGVLSCQSEGNVVLVVRLVDAAVQPWNPEEQNTSSLSVFVGTFLFTQCIPLLWIPNSYITSESVNGLPLQVLQKFSNHPFSFKSRVLGAEKWVKHAA